MTWPRLAELLVRRGRLSGSGDALAPTVAAAVRADVASSVREHARPRFRIVANLVGLTEWQLPREAARTEENVTRHANRQREQMRRAFIGKLNDLPAAGFAEIIATWLNAEGVTTLRAVRRPGSSGNEFHFAGTLRRGTEETRLSLVVQRSGRDIDRDAVITARGTLHHYGNATSTWLITTGRVQQSARDEAGLEAATPCALFDGAELAAAMERAGVGLRTQYVPICDIDLDLLEALGDSGEGRGRRDRDKDKDKDKDRDSDRRSRRRDRDERKARGKDRDKDEASAEEAATAKGAAETDASEEEPESASAEASEASDPDEVATEIEEIPADASSEDDDDTPKADDDSEDSDDSDDDKDDSGDDDSDDDDDDDDD